MPAEFPIVRRGYDTERVDAHLATVTAELDRLAADNRELRRSLADAGDPAATDPARVLAEPDAAAVEIIRAAHEEARRVRTEAGSTQMEAIRGAHDEAARILAEAELAAVEIVTAARTDGEADAAELVSSAQTRAIELVSSAQFGAERIRTDAEADATQLVSTAHTEADRVRTALRAEVEAARAELDRLVRARVEVHRELAALGEALRNWLGPSANAQGEGFAPATPKALASSRRPPRPPPPPRVSPGGR